MRSRLLAAAAGCALLMGGATGRAVEPNETFDDRTFLSSGVLSVIDDLAGEGLVPPIPDTLLGVRDLFGSIYFTDDNSSPYGDGTASGIGGVPIDSGSIDFAVTGYGDDGFFGSHGEQGDYEVFVDVYDFFGDLVDSFSEVHTLEPGGVDDFYYSDFNWLNGSYDVYIDNLVGFVSDVDFFTFQGLAPGTEFTAETTNVDAGDIDTLLGWFDEGGTLLDVNDDIDLEAGNYLSRLTGAVPASGTLTFAVTGYGDDDFLGYHEQFEAYELILSLAGGGSPADFDGSGAVDAGDLGTWGANFGASGASPSQGDANGDGVVSGVDFLIWQQETSGPTGSAGGVPEPAAAGLALVGLAVAAAGRRRR